MAGRGEAGSAVDAGTFRFVATPPLPTYLFAFAAGRFRVVEAPANGPAGSNRRLRMFHRETDATKVARNRDAVFDLHRTALAWLEDYTSLPYPFEKFDFVLLPSFQYGGMEHPGAVFYRQESVLLEESATQAELLARASLIAHETSHMWFGDLVTLNWFDDVWTKEVFANFMAAKIVQPSFPGVLHDLRFLLAHHPYAYDVDRTRGANPIRQPLENLREAGTLYGAVIYHKAPVVMRHLEARVGEKALQEGLREYLRTFAFGNATWNDLIRVLDARSPEDLAAWSRVWVEEPGRPTVRVVLETKDGRIERLGLAQVDEAGKGRIWPQRLTLALVYGDSVERAEVDLSEAEASLDAWRGRPAPVLVLPNAGGLEYGRFVLDDRSLAALMGRLPTLEDPLLRGAAWVTVWDAVLDGAVPPDRFVALALQSLRTEDVELNLQRILDTLEATYWRLLLPEARAALAPELELALWRGAAESESRTLRAAFFSTYRRVALSQEGRRRLRRLWTGAEPAPVPLGESDRIGLADEQALRGMRNWASILDTQARLISNPDRRARFDWVRPSLSTDSLSREAFFASLLEASNRKREPWVLEGLSWLNHPLRQEHARPFIAPALAELEEVQRTGDIFFPEAWLEAVLWGHNTPEAARSVQEFLDTHPDYPPRLRAKVLQAADGLFRGARIVYGHGEAS